MTLARRAADMRRELGFLLESEEKSYVYWYERRGKGVFLAATPIDVSQILREKLFDQFDTVYYYVGERSPWKAGSII